MDEGSEILALLSESFIKHDAASQLFIIGIDLLAQLVDKLVKAKVDFSFDFVIQELLFKDSQSVVSTIVVQIQRIQDTSVKTTIN